MRCILLLFYSSQAADFRVLFASAIKMLPAGGVQASGRCQCTKLIYLCGPRVMLDRSRLRYEIFSQSGLGDKREWTERIFCTKIVFKWTSDSILMGISGRAPAFLIIVILEIYCTVIQDMFCDQGHDQVKDRFFFQHKFL